MSIDHVKQKAKRDKKVLLVITDGDDNSSANSLEKLVREAQQSEVLVYAIGLLTEEAQREAKRARRALDNLTEATGGQSYYPKELGEVDKIAQKVAHEIRNQYVIGYSPSNPALDGSFRQIKVTATGPNRPTVRTRSGYYATREAGGAKKSSD
jgi:VWFA-related protein